MSMNRIMLCSSMAIAFALSASFAIAQTKPNTIKLGASVQLSGSLANTGRYYRDAYDLAVSTINDKGGVTIGGQKYKLTLDILDNQSDANLSVRQYVQLVARDKVNFLLGPCDAAFFDAKGPIEAR